MEFKKNSFVEGQIKKAGTKMNNGTYVFHGKREDIMLDDNGLRILDSYGNEPNEGIKKVNYILNLYSGKAVPLEEDDCALLLMHSILKSNGKSGIEMDSGVISYFNEYIDKNPQDF